MPIARLLILVTTLALVATATLGAASASAVTVNCGIKRYSFVFWPKGNSKDRHVHMDFYRLTRTFSQRAFIAGIDLEGRGNFPTYCKRRTFINSFRAVTRRARTRSATTLRCGFPRNATIAVHPISDEDEELGIHILLGKRSVLFAQLYYDKPPVLTYDKVFCHRAKLPS